MQGTNDLGTGHAYRKEFFDYIDVGSQRSAAKVVGVAAEIFRPSSVLDVGCGRGVWVAQWLKNGVEDCLGLDGDYVASGQIVVPERCFRSCDLSRPFDLGRRFDLVQSLEVAEHVDAEMAEVFVDNLCRHGDLIVFSAAVPGQGGEMHVNERPLEYWRLKFRDRGYDAFDCLRPRIAGDRAIEPWYRYNCLVYLKSNSRQSLSLDLGSSHLKNGATIPNMASFNWRVRNAALRRLPVKLVSRLAVLKHRAYNMVRKV